MDDHIALTITELLAQQAGIENDMRNGRVVSARRWVALAGRVFTAINETKKAEAVAPLGHAHGAIVMTPIKAADMPKPDAVVEQANGDLTVAMFFYGMPEGTDMRQVAAENGFASMFIAMDDETERPEVEALWKEYSEGGDGQDIYRRWQPEVPEGWTLADKYDTEDGPYAILIKPRREVSRTAEYLADSDAKMAGAEPFTD